ncbi:pitrilysin family protein [Lebetimonas sp. JS032]|nr:pitrilysin family protein [Lebetimonas sp. JS032]
MIIFEKDCIGRSFLQIVFLNSGSIFFKDGVANFAKEILNRGTSKKKEKFFSFLDENAINLNFGINHEYFTVSVKCLNNKRKKALDSLIELFSDINLTKEAFEKTKREIIAKKESLKNNNDYIANKNLYRAIFENTPLAIPVIGENIENITKDDIKNFFNELSENVIIINGGEKFDYEKFIKLFPKKEKEYPFFEPIQKNIKENKEVEQSYIYFASEYNIEKKEIHLAKIATFILGSGGFGSRIMEKIRVKKGYAYSAYAFNTFKKTHKILSGYMQTKLENTEDAINSLKNIINDFTQNGITAEELNDAKKFLLGSEPLRNETLSQRLLKKFNEVYLNLPENYYQKELDLIKNTKLNEINDFIK